MYDIFDEELIHSGSKDFVNHLWYIISYAVLRNIGQGRLLNVKARHLFILY